MQWFIVIAFQLSELKYVQRDTEYLKEYLNKHKVEKELKERILKRLAELRRDYLLRVCSFMRHLIDIPMVLKFLGVDFLSDWIASMIGTVTSLISLYTLRI